MNAPLKCDHCGGTTTAHTTRYCPGWVKRFRDEDWDRRIDDLDAEYVAGDLPESDYWDELIEARRQLALSGWEYTERDVRLYTTLAALRAAQLGGGGNP